jgi:hypothetical protein
MVITSGSFGNYEFVSGDPVWVGQEEGIFASESDNPSLARVEMTTGPQSGTITLVVKSQIKPRH